MPHALQPHELQPHAFDVSSQVDAALEMRVHDDLLHEALRACHAFLSGRFSMEVGVPHTFVVQNCVQH
jgi:hypothetical protein